MSEFKYHLKKIIQNPLFMIAQGWRKLVTDPIKYTEKGRFKAKKYWDDRFSKYGDSILAAGDESLTIEENWLMYRQAEQVVIDILKKSFTDFEHLRVLEIGCGTGFYTKTLQGLGVKNLSAVDITSTLFEKHKATFPNYRFIQKDVTKDIIEGAFDLILMIDVIEHIIEESSLRFAMANIRKCLAENGVVLLSPVDNINRKHLYYVRFWSLRIIQECFPDGSFKELIPFRKSFLLTIQNRINR